MMHRLIVLLSLLVLAAVQPAHSAQLKLGVLPAADTIVLQTKACSPNRGWKWSLSPSKARWSSVPPCGRGR